MNNSSDKLINEYFEGEEKQPSLNRDKVDSRINALISVAKKQRKEVAKGAVRALLALQNEINSGGLDEE